MGFMQDELTRDVYERLGRIDGKLDGLNHIRDTAIRAEGKADEALSSTINAHVRLDKVDKIIWWVGTAVGGVILVALLNLVIKVGGAG